MFPSLVEFAKDPSLPVGEYVVMAVEALRRSPRSGPVPRRLALGVVVVFALKVSDSWPPGSEGLALTDTTYSSQSWAVNALELMVRTTRCTFSDPSRRR
jgi:hypothetical protein